MKLNLSLAILAFCIPLVKAFSEEKPKSALACLERFLSNSTRLSNNSAMYAQLEATETSASSPGPLAIEWFKICGVEKNNTAHTYLETRYVYPDRPENQVWEKVLHVGRDRFLCRGWASQKLQPIPILQIDNDEKVTYRNSPLFHVPDVVALTLLPNSQFLLKRDQDTHLVRWANFVLEDFCERETDAGFVGVWLSGQYFLEITFAKDQFYMPTEVRAFFPPKQKPSLDADPKTFLVDKAYDVRTKWKNTEGVSSIQYPVSVVNTVHKVNPTSKNGREMEIRASWEIGSIEAKSLCLEKLSADDDDQNEFISVKEELKKKTLLRSRRSRGTSTSQ